jgi:hypothetical protein
VALTMGAVRRCTEKQLVGSDHAEWCFLAIIHISAKILLLLSQDTKTCALNHGLYCSLCIFAPYVPDWGNSKNIKPSLKHSVFQI